MKLSSKRIQELNNLISEASAEDESIKRAFRTCRKNITDLNIAIIKKTTGSSTSQIDKSFRVILDILDKIEGSI